jgi:hypothetical protein
MRAIVHPHGIAPAVAPGIKRRSHDMEERTVVEKRTEVEREEPVVSGTKNINIAADGSTQVQESGDMVDDPVGATTVRKETTVEERRSS